jgi:hypothetical protein
MSTDADFSGTLLDVEFWDQCLWVLLALTSVVMVAVLTPTVIGWTLRAFQDPPESLPEVGSAAASAAAAPASADNPPDDRPVAQKGGLAKVQPRAGREKRKHPRREGAPMPVLLEGEGIEEVPIACSVVDRSRGGLGIVLDRRLEPGTLVTVRPVDAPEDVATVRVKVCTCRRRGRGWYVGCRFTEELPWSVVLLFG